MRKIALCSKQEENAAIRAAVSVLKRGGVIAFPTETVYGLGCDPASSSAIRRLYRMKGREERKPLQLIAASSVQVTRLARMKKGERHLASRHWPGPLTLLVQKKEHATLDRHTVEDGRIGIRVTSDAFIRKLLRAYGKPIAATSANKSGSPPARSGDELFRAFLSGQRPDLLLDAGTLPHREPSTVARLDENGAVTILRHGAIRLPKRLNN